MKSKVKLLMCAVGLVCSFVPSLAQAITMTIQPDASCSYLLNSIWANSSGGLGYNAFSAVFIPPRGESMALPISSSGTIDVPPFSGNIEVTGNIDNIQVSQIANDVCTCYPGEQNCEQNIQACINTFVIATGLIPIKDGGAIPVTCTSQIELSSKFKSKREKVTSPTELSSRFKSERAKALSHQLQ
jgi:hypothetical protein